MAETMWGADVDQLDALARTFDANADKLSNSEATVSNALSTTNWTGDDSDVFHQDWSGTRQPQIQALTDALRETSRQLREHANQQRAASEGNGSGGGNQHAGVAVGTGAQATSLSMFAAATSGPAAGIAPGGCLPYPPWDWEPPIYRLPDVPRYPWPYPQPPWDYWWPRPPNCWLPPITIDPPVLPPPIIIDPPRWDPPIILPPPQPPRFPPIDTLPAFPPEITAEDPGVYVGPDFEPAGLTGSHASVGESYAIGADVSATETGTSTMGARDNVSLSSSIGG